MKNPLVSILTPTWNAARFLPATYESLRAQSVRRWEWICSDDGSTDDTLAVLRELAAQDSRIVIEERPNSGLPAVGRNAAARLARGKFLAFLDADDTWKPEKLQRQLAFLRANSRIGLTYCWVNHVADPGCMMHWMWQETDVPERARHFLLKEGNVLCTSSILFHRRVWDMAGEQDTDPAIRAMEDHEWIIRAASKTRIARTPGHWVRYRVHGENASVTINRHTMRALLVALDRNGLLDGDERRGMLSDYYIIQAEEDLVAGRQREARDHFLRAVRADPRRAARWPGLLSWAMPARPYLTAYRAMKRLQGIFTRDANMANHPVFRTPAAPDS